MKTLQISIFGILLTLTSVQSQYMDVQPLTDDLSLAWFNYQMAHNKTYASNDEAAMRRKIWEQNVAEIRQHNEEAAAGKHTYTMGVNYFSDLTAAEFMSTYTYPIPAEPSTSNITGDINLNFEDYKLDIDLIDRNDEYLNWVVKGAVSDVQSQGRCGACWAFSSIGAIEGQNVIINRRHKALSVQQLLDCCNKHCDGCGGCSVRRAFECALRLGGLESRYSYPYTGEDGLCRFRPDRVVAKIRGHKVYYGEESLYHVIRYRGPASVNFVVTEKFRHYREGIFTDSDCNYLLMNHAMLAVGYSARYWIVKNSFGRQWGEQGYMRVIRGLGGVGMCQIAALIQIPVMA